MGKQVEIVSIGKDHTVELNREQLERILLDPKVKDKPVAVVSIMGAYRQGKSFLLNFLLRYLRSRGKSNWMGDQNTSLEGFSWSTSFERNTKGINVWDEVFLVHTPTGDELAVLLMDTQGAFDSESSADETANIFALSILTSSVQIYNIFNNLQEDHLQHLQLVAEYGTYAQKDMKDSPFQRLVFLIRDWQFLRDAPHGCMGGREILQRFMATRAQQHEDNKDLRQSLSSCMSSMDCFLMPHPGKRTANGSSEGRLRDLDDDFKQELRNLVPWLVSAENLHAKKIAGEKITCEQLMNYFTVYVNLFRDGNRPRVKTILQVTAHEINRKAMENAKTFYTDGMHEESYKNADELQKKHNMLLEKAQRLFRDTRKIGGDDVAKEYMAVLEKEINQSFSYLYDKQKSLDEKEEELERGRQKLIAHARNLVWATGTTSAILTPVAGTLAVVAPPAGLAAGAVTAATYGAFGVAVAEYRRLNKEPAKEKKKDSTTDS